ncbi:MAG: 30S ribosomal protein S27ae [Candidatus ainarchaeum sp.]|nr:30S ribosomal protein S27ae [Candidatus ainarchaeum sp.]
MAEKKQKPKIKKSKKYSVNAEEIKRTGKFCPKCGPGIFMAEHKDRYSCGKCSYTEKK